MTGSSYFAIPSVQPDKLWGDFESICNIGGRVAGTHEEERTLALLEHRLSAYAYPVQSYPFSFTAWNCEKAELAIIGDTTSALPCVPLVYATTTPDEGIAAPVLDAGRGTLAELDALAAEIPGKIVLMRHEYMFSTEHVHRFLKLTRAAELGAVGALFAADIPEVSSVTGASQPSVGLPAVGISNEVADRFRRSDPLPIARIKISGQSGVSTSRNLILDIPGHTNEIVVVSAHVDGHALAESAIDNASGVAAVLAVADAVTARASPLRRGVRFCLFGAEEWGLIGSERYLAGMDLQEQNAIALNVNIDSVGFGAKTTALTSGFANLDQFCNDLAQEYDLNIATHGPFMPNSDHANFARRGIPAMRLVGGFNDPTSNARFVLTDGDTRDKVDKSHLVEAVRAALVLTMRAASAEPATIRALRVPEAQSVHQ